MKTCTLMALLAALSVFNASAKSMDLQSWQVIDDYIETVNTKSVWETDAYWLPENNSATSALRASTAVAFLKGFTPNASTITEQCQNNSCALTVFGNKNGDMNEVVFAMRKHNSKYYISNVSVKKAYLAQH